MIFLTSPGKTYSVNSSSGCTISAGGTTLATIPANVQTTFIAPDEEVTVSDNNAIIVEVTGVGAGGSGVSGEGGSGGVTAEEIKAVVPMAWGAYSTAPTVDTSGKSIAIGDSCVTTQGNAVAIGQYSGAGGQCVSIGYRTGADPMYSVAIGCQSTAPGTGVSIGWGCSGRSGEGYCITIGTNAYTSKSRALSIGSSFTETTPDGNVTNYCTTEGTGSITIGAGANTLNTKTTVDGVETTVESSNSVTIGCKASNTGADSVVIGAGARNDKSGNVTIGPGANGIANSNQVIIGNKAEGRSVESIAIGAKSLSVGWCSHAFGYDAQSRGSFSTAVGKSAYAASERAQAFGYGARAADVGVVVFASQASESLGANQTKTQLYFSGANTPLANTYEGGEAMMGYVTKDSAGNILAAGTQKLSVLFPNNSTFQPASLDENGEWVQPKVFHPSDLDLPVEEPTEPEPYTPLPVYPIVEPEIEEIPSES